MVKVNYGQLSGQASSISSATQGRVSGYQSLISSFTDFSGAPDLTGSAYNSAKNYATGTMTAFYQACILYAEAVVDAANKLSDSYANYCGGEDLDETQLRAEIESANRGCLSLSASISGLESKKKKTAKDNSRLAELRNQVAQAEEQIRTTQEKLNHLLAFDGESASANSDADSLKTTVETAASEIENSFSDGGFSVPADSTWRTTVSGLWAQRAQNLENAYQVALTKLQKGENLTEADLTAIERYNTEHPGKVDQAVMDQVKALRSEKKEMVEESKVNAIIQKAANGNSLTEEELKLMNKFIEKKSNEGESFIDYLKDNLKGLSTSAFMDAVTNSIEQTGIAVERLGGLMNVVTGIKGPSGSSSFVMVNPNSSGSFMLEKGAKVVKVGKGLGYGVMGIGFGVGVYDDIANEKKTVGQAVAHNGVSTAIGWGAAALTTLAFTNPVGWAAVGVAALSIAVSVAAVSIYEYSYKHSDVVKNMTDGIGWAIDKGLSNPLPVL